MFTIILIMWMTLFIFKFVHCQYKYEMDDDGAHGVRISGNDYFAISAINRYKLYDIFPAPYTNTNSCKVSYPDNDQYIYSLGAIFDRDNPDWNKTYTFVQVAENTKTADVFFSIIQINKSICGELT